MAMQELNQVEINEVAGALSLNLGLGAITLDPAATISNALDTANGLVNSLLSVVPALSAITIPALGLSLNAG